MPMISGQISSSTATQALRTPCRRIVHRHHEAQRLRVHLLTLRWELRRDPTLRRRGPLPPQQWGFRESKDLSGNYDVDAGHRVSFTSVVDEGDSTLVGRLKLIDAYALPVNCSWSED